MSARQPDCVRIAPAGRPPLFPMDWARSRKIARAPHGAPHFPWALWQLLLHPAGRDLAYWVSPTHFVLSKNAAKMKDYLLRFFRTGRLASFTRQLNYWGFQFHSKDGVWSNPAFQQQLHVPTMLARMERKGRAHHAAPADVWEESKGWHASETWEDPGVLAQVKGEFARASLDCFCE
jgi:hypothetical protein